MAKLDITKLLTEEQDISKVIGILQGGRLTPLPDYGRYIKQLDPKQHDVMDPAKRPDKMVNVDAEDPNYGQTTNIMVNADDSSLSEKRRIEPVARIALAIQKLIVKRSVGITFGNPVKYKATPENDAEQALYDAVMRVLKDAKERPLNRKVARQVYGMTEVAERWYVTEGKDMHKRYSSRGTPFKLRCVVFSPRYGDTLYPCFDDDRDMIAFSRSFKQKDEKGATHTYFETLTAEKFWMWETSGDGSKGSGWALVDGYPQDNPYGKIPVIYGHQDEPDYEDVQTLISRLEKMLSNFADTNDYFGNPKMVVKGRVEGFCRKGEAGGIMEVDPDGSIDILSWAQAPDSIKTEYATLKELIHTITQTPDISWDSVKGLNVSGVALELMFMDAILKVMDKEEIWLDYLTRRVNLIMAMLANVDISFKEPAKSLIIEPEIVPYIIIDKQTRTNIELALAGNKQLKSRRTAMRDLGIDNVETELEDIAKEEEADNMFMQDEPTMA